jgi:hypothetical protein
MSLLNLPLMKRLLSLATFTFFIIVASSVNVHAQGRDSRTSSARAAYGSTAPNFRVHKKKNAKSKKKARKEAKRKQDRNKNVPYRRGMPI